MEERGGWLQGEVESMNREDYLLNVASYRKKAKYAWVTNFTTIEKHFFFIGSNESLVLQWIEGMT